MDTCDELEEVEFDHLESICSFKDNIAVISMNNNTFYNHVNIFDLKPDDDLQVELDEQSNSQHISDTIFDISKITQKIELDEITSLTLKTLNPHIDISKNEIKEMDAKIKSNRSESDIQLIVEDASYGLKNRRKGEKLSYDQISFLKLLSKDSNIPAKEIWRTYNVSTSVLNKIIRATNEEINKIKVKNFAKIYGSQQLKLFNWLQCYVKNNKSTFTAKEATNFVNSKLNTEYSVITVRKFMKTKMKMSFKRVKSRPTNVNLEKIDKIRSLFAVKLSKEITSNTLLINIDETSINRFVKTNYSWGYKGKPIESRNASFTGSIS